MAMRRQARGGHAACCCRNVEIKKKTATPPVKHEEVQGGWGLRRMELMAHGDERQPTAPAIDQRTGAKVCSFAFPVVLGVPK